MHTRIFALVLGTTTCFGQLANAACEELLSNTNGTEWFACVQKELDEANRRILELETAVSAIPEGMVAFFAGECAVGWSAYHALQGRYVVGAYPESSSIGMQVGDPLGNGEKRVSGKHSHTVDDQVIAHPDWRIPKKEAFSGLATEFRFPNSRSVDLWKISWTSSDVGSGDAAAPYVQLRACIKD